MSSLYGIVCIVQCLLDHYEIPTGAIHVKCDNEQALHIFDPEFLPEPQQANFDLICQILEKSVVHLVEFV